MKISSDILFRGLAESYSLDVTGKLSGTLSLGTVFFVSDNQKFEDGAIYMSPKKNPLPMPKRKTASVLIVCEAPPAEAAKRFETVIIAHNADIFDVHNSIQEIFKIYDAWNSDLRRILNEGSDVQAMIDASTPIMDCPLILQDSNYSPIAVSKRYVGNPMLDPVLDSSNVPYLMQSDRQDRGRYPGAPSVIPMKLADRQALYMNLFQQGRFRYRLLLIGDVPSVSSPNLLEYLSTYIQLAIGFVVSDDSNTVSLPRILERMLSGEYRDSDFVDQSLSGFGWRSTHSYIIAKVYADIPDFNNRTLRFMCDRLKNVFPEAAVLEHDRSIAIIFNLDISSADAAGITAALENYLRDNNLRAGICDTFTGFGYFREYYAEAEIALNLGPSKKPYSWLYTFADAAETFITKSCTDILPTHMICDKRLLKLKEYDEKHNQDLYNTLYVYVKNNLRSVNAAKELYIHRSTFLYRIDRIKEITGISFDDEESLWYMLLSFKLLESGE